jgi:hypothetical protein
MVKERERERKREKERKRLDYWDYYLYVVKETLTKACSTQQKADLHFIDLTSHGLTDLANGQGHPYWLSTHDHFMTSSFSITHSINQLICLEKFNLQ